jgi:hypothetical protein
MYRVGPLASFSSLFHMRGTGSIYRDAITLRAIFGICPHNPSLGFLNTPPWANTATNTCLVKTPKKPVRKIWRKSAWWYKLHLHFIASLKTSCEKLQENSLREKSTTTVIGTDFDPLGSRFYRIFLQGLTLEMCSPWSLQNCINKAKHLLLEVYAHKDLAIGLHILARTISGTLPLLTSRIYEVSAHININKPLWLMVFDRLNLYIW